ncbi:T9SS type A sorting domain-containing protein [Natronoflexus pectinivorans]|uniref:Putative secreted protein (Por secretion system target) n=1 Tax=Natronoflexus pectinivorans TaxID=682526 RepID=A0A4R2GLC7_9BACT|nr:T9SS type A sorting domain-containing protein [Natronoflexus pectinivorans]TCO09775.1 putative secreted protein (Por secretion system target) [Natronoflexus pectinivorans]
MSSLLKHSFIAIFVNIAFSLYAEDRIQNPIIYGTPDAYQNYFVFNSGDHPEILNWRVDIYKIIREGDSENYELVESQFSRDGENYLRINPQRFEDPSTQKLFKVYGQNSSGETIAEDQWIEKAMYPATEWVPVCYSICNGRTYAYKIEILEEYNMNTGQPLNNGYSAVRINGSYGTYTYDEDDNIYSPLYRYMNFTEWESLKANSQSTQHDPNAYLNWNTFAHYDVSWSVFNQNNQQLDGVKLMKIPNSTTGNYRDMNNQWIVDDVYAIQKALGHYKDYQEMVAIIQVSAESVCGELVSQNPDVEIGLFNNHANTWLDLDPAITCNGTGYDNPPTDWDVGSTGNWMSMYKKAIDFIPPPNVGGNSDFGDIFEWMEFIFDEFPISDNNTGVYWWPGDDIRTIQFYQVSGSRDDRTDFSTPITIHQDDLFDSEGAPKNHSFPINNGLYSLVLHTETNISLPYIFEVVGSVQTSVNSLKQNNKYNIYPNPSNGIYTIEVSQKSSVRVFNISGQLVHSSEIHEGKTQISMEHLPGGLYNIVIYNDSYRVEDKLIISKN